MDKKYFFKTINNVWSLLFIIMTLFLFAGCDMLGENIDFESEDRIIGGNEAQEGRYSYIVSLQDKMGHFCGGSLIAKDIVLTAAHCQGGKYSVVINRHDLGKNNGEKINMKKEIPHPKYNDKTTNYDFNVVILEKPITEDVALVKLNSEKTVPASGAG